MITVAIVEDQTIVREGLVRLLEFSSDIKVVGSVANGEDALVLMETVHPDVILLDIQMPIMDGFEFITAARNQWQHNNQAAAKIILLTTFDDQTYLRKAIELGVHGFLLKDVSFDDLIDTVKQVFQGQCLLPAMETAAQYQPTLQSPIDNLTPREREIFAKLCKGMANKEVANHLSLSEGTIKNHVSNILSKLGVRDRMQAVIKYGPELSA